MKYRPDSDVILEVTDMFGSIIKFEKSNYNRHKDKHPELRQKQFCPGQITMALERPTFTINSMQKGALCYYLELFRVRNVIKYVKVVVQETNRPNCTIKTAFKTDHVQELKYGFEPTWYNK